MPEDLVLIKFGGSLITDKSKICLEKIDVIEQLCTMAKNIISMGKKLVIVHGAGSFGHIKAKKSNLFEGKNINNYESQLLSIKEVRRDMLSLNEIILDSLKKQNLSAESYIPHKEGKGDGINYIFSNKIDDLLNSNTIPVTYGDVVDTADTKEFGILSGDDICELLTRKLNVSHVVFAIDGADGIVDDPNLENGGNLIKNYSIEHRVVLNKVKNDVTGGMDLKIKRGYNCFKHGSRVSIINGKKTQMIINAIKGIDYIGTEFVN